MMRRLLPRSLTCAGILIVLPSVAADGTGNPAGGLAYAGLFLGTIAAALFLIMLLRLGTGRLAGAVAERLDRRRVHRKLKALCPDLLHDFILPGAYGGLTRIDYGIPTAGGIICIRAVFQRGSVSGRADEPQWTNEFGGQHRTFLNPLIQNEGRSRALQQVVPESPVSSLIVFGDSVRFDTAMADNVIRTRELEEYLAAAGCRPTGAAEAGQCWLAVKAAALTDDQSRKDFGAQLSFS